MHTTHIRAHRTSHITHHTTCRIASDRYTSEARRRAGQVLALRQREANACQKMVALGSLLADGNTGMERNNKRQTQAQAQDKVAFSRLDSRHLIYRLPLPLKHGSRLKRRLRYSQSNYHPTLNPSSYKQLSVCCVSFDFLLPYSLFLLLRAVYFISYISFLLLLVFESSWPFKPPLISHIHRFHNTRTILSIPTATIRIVRFHSFRRF
jgi:hypothetical protein